MLTLTPPSPRSLYPRFYDAFAAAGEASIPVDAALLRSDAFAQLLVRLRLLAAQHHRDHWWGTTHLVLEACTGSASDGSDHILLPFDDTNCVADSSRHA